MGWLAQQMRAECYGMLSAVFISKEAGKDEETFSPRTPRRSAALLPPGC